jgi:hypothetical protein
MNPWWIYLVTFSAALVVVLWARRPRRPARPADRPADRPPADPSTYPQAALPIMHLLDKLTERPVCGASIRERWTVVLETATCPECRKQADMAMLQWEVNNR